MTVTISYHTRGAPPEAGAAPPDEPCRELALQAMIIAGQALRAHGIPHRSRTVDQRGETPEENPLARYGAVLLLCGAAEGCEDLFFGWTRHQDWDTGLPRHVWDPLQFCKTGGAADPRSAHTAVAAVVSEWEKYGLVHRVKDEAGWLPDHDEEMLARSLGPGPRG